MIDTCQPLKFSARAASIVSLAGPDLASTVMCCVSIGILRVLRMIGGAP